MKRSNSLPEVVINSTTKTTTSKTHDSEEKWKKENTQAKISTENKDNINEQTEAYVSVPEHSLAKPTAVTKLIRDPYHMIKITEFIEINSKNSDLATNTNNCFIEPSTATTMTTTTTMMNNNESDENVLNCFSENIATISSVGSFNSNEKSRPQGFFETRFNSIKSNREESSCLNYISNPSSNLGISRPKIKLSDSLKESLEPRRLPILVEKVSQTCIEDFIEAEKKSEEVTKPTEIVLEIINISSLNDPDEKNTNDSVINNNNKLQPVFEDLNAIQTINTKPKKITIRITGKTRSASSDKMNNFQNQPLENIQQQQQAFLIKPTTTFFSPLTPFKPPLLNDTGIKNSSSLDVGIYDSFRPIDQERIDDSYNRFYTSSIDEYNPNLRAQLASEENSTLTLSETKFDLDKFKSYLNAFNTHHYHHQMTPTVQFQQRSTSMPPPLFKINSTNQQQHQEQNRIFNTYDSDMYDLRPIKETNMSETTNQEAMKIRTAYNNRKNLSFLEDQKMKKPATRKTRTSMSVSDTEEEPIWTYREQSQKYDNNVKKIIPQQSQLQPILQKSIHSNAVTKRFGCGLFNKSSRLSMKLEEDEEGEEDENDNDGFDENEMERNFKECSELSNRSLQLPKSPRFDHLNLSHLNSPSTGRQTLSRLHKERNIQSENQHQSRKKISSYYNDYYSKQNRIFGALAAKASSNTARPSTSVSADISDTSTTRFIDDDATTITSNNADEENDTEVDCDCNQIDEMSGDENAVDDGFDLINRRSQDFLYVFKPNNKFTTFLPQTSNSPKTPKLVRKVLFADQI